MWGVTLSTLCFLILHPFFMKIAIKKFLSPLEKESSNWLHGHCLRGLQWRVRILLFCFVVVVILIKLFFSQRFFPSDYLPVKDVLLESIFLKLEIMNVVEDEEK